MIAPRDSWMMPPLYNEMIPPGAPANPEITPGGIIPLWGARSSRNRGAASSRYRGRNHPGIGGGFLRNQQALGCVRGRPVEPAEQAADRIAIYYDYDSCTIMMTARQTGHCPQGYAQRISNPIPVAASVRVDLGLRTPNCAPVAIRTSAPWQPTRGSQCPRPSSMPRLHHGPDHRS
jgi:hypothetical protein